MMVFLMAVYVGVLALLVRLKVLKNSKWVWLSIIPFNLLLLVALFIPMGFAAPEGNVVVWQPVTLMTSRVAGRVVAVYVRGNEPVKRGDKLIQIDPEAYQLEVNRLDAALAEAEQNVPILQATYDAAKESTGKAQAQLNLA
ncbi:MAG TPA: biotin/lipoyl-binding protein [Gemmataceae bacterium]|nr:biotin/lipoyl-binding protein [Gemmataceae bacterium]